MVDVIKKGKRFEQEISHYLTRITGKKWMRTPHSGAYGTTHNIQQQMGDVCTQEPSLSHILIECKHYKTLNLNDIFNYNSKVWRWVLRAESQSDHWYLFIKADYVGTYCITKDDLDLLKLKGQSLSKGIYHIIKLEELK